MERSSLIKRQLIINGKIADFYKGLFSEQGVWQPLLDGLDLLALEEVDSKCLERCFMEDEVYETVSNMSGDKALGPDGFMMAFFQSCWGFVKVDLIMVFHHFHEHYTFEKSFNATFVSLIPKKPGAAKIKDFLPISSITGVYKILAKVLAKRLKLVLCKVVSVPQNAFVSKRQILD